MTSQNLPLPKSFYLLDSRVLTHILFWLIYYLTFSFLWAKDGNLYASFGLELVLMPVRISASYLTMYLLIPEFLLKDRVLKFVFSLIAALIVAGILQRLLIYFFYELFFEQKQTSLWDISAVIRAIVLVNSTVLLLSALKMYSHWRLERDKNRKAGQVLVEIRSEKRTYRLNPMDIAFVEGLGNYVTYYFVNRKPLISYSSLKEVEQSLPDNFVRIHKSFVVNKDWIESYTTDNVEVQGRMLPIGKSVSIAFN